MGCCEARGTKKDSKMKSAEFDGKKSVSADEEVEGLSNEEMLELKERKPLHLLDRYLTHLIGLSTWNTQINKKDIVIKTINNSIFTNSVPVVLGYLTFDFKVPHEIICKLIENDLRWDSSLVGCTVLNQGKACQVLRIVKKFPVKNRVFNVRRYFFEAAGSLNYLSVNENLPENDESLEKGWYHFSLVKIKDHNGKTCISQVLQIDNVQEPNIYLNYISGNELFEWLQRVKSKVLKLS